jgi:hypothetical protein
VAHGNIFSGRKLAVLQTPDDQVEREIYHAVSRGFEYLFKVGQGKGHWKRVDHTSLAAMALTIREPKSSPWVKAVRKWLISQQTEMEEGVASWDESVSDSAMALIALLRIGVLPNDPAVVKVLKFLSKVFNYKARPNWEDEPWETSWSITAIAEAGDPEALDEACQALRWLAAMQEPSGAIIAPHYTAYFINAVRAICHRQTSSGYCVIDEAKLQEQAKKASEYLMRTMDDEELWTGEAWSNGQILWCLASGGRFPIEDQTSMSKTVSWFVRNQGTDGNWFDSEDTACAILGLVALLKDYLLHKAKGQGIEEDAETVIYNHLRRLYEAPKLNLGKKFVEVQEDGTTTLNFSPRAIKTAAIIFAIISGMTVIIALWDFIEGRFLP